MGLQGEISGEVSVSMADRTDGNLRKAEEATNLRFAQTISLTAGDGDDDDDDGYLDNGNTDIAPDQEGSGVANPVNTVPKKVASAAQSVYGIATGLVLTVTMVM